MPQSKLIDTSYTQNRELSWLKFNERVLEEAADTSVPLYERLKFAAIFTNNLDEFFMVRVGSLFELSLIKDNKFDNKSFLKPSEQLTQIFAASSLLYAKRDKVFFAIDNELEKEGLHRIRTLNDLNREEQKYIDHYFNETIFPILSPQIIDLHHPFPHLLNKMLHIAVLLKHQKLSTLGIIPIPSALPRVIYFPENSLRYILIEQIILEYAYKIFNMYSLIDKAIIAVTRNADISPDDEAPELGEDYLHHMKRTLKKRRSLAPVRLEMQTDGDSLLIDYLRKRLQIKKDQTYISKTPLDLSYVFSLEEKFSTLQRQKLLYPPFTPIKKCKIPAYENMLDAVTKKDLLLQYPYQSFDLFLKLIREAINDKDVISIKITIYRLGKHRAKLMNYLITASESGKEVTVLMELKARFDEANNINWAENLSEAGCKILYGFEGYKVHSKICLIMRRSTAGKITYITQIGTGNYNAQTSLIYTDISLITADERIGRDANIFFKNMGLANLNGFYQSLLVAPFCLKSQLLAYISDEIGKAKNGLPTKIILKMNSLTDRQLIDALAKASQAGVQIDLIIRGICCLLPDIPGKTENIQVRSIVGRFLEHSRVFCFGIGEDMKMFISSADWMTRNTENRVEITCPVYDKGIRMKIYRTLRLMLTDNVKGRQLQSNGTYCKCSTQSSAPFDSQQYFMEEYLHYMKKQL
jgi:polyphosphate kinase